VIGRDSVVYYKGEKAPSVLDIEGFNISVIRIGDGTNSTSANRVAVVVGASVGGVVVLAAIAVVMWILWLKRKKPEDWDYDSVPVAGTDNSVPLIDI
jgi:hypothetical protein